MTVGEKIQYYRKRIGLSQEALGQKMLVSRQTVSLWEMDKTLPTIDNLLRLKEIFSVSIDDILSESELAEAKAAMPKEVYTFRHEKSDLQKIFKQLRLIFIKQNVIFFCLIYIFPLIACLRKDVPDITFGGILGAFLISLFLTIKSYILYKKSLKISENKVPKNIYSYQIFDGYFCLNISQNEEITKTMKIYFEDIEKILSIDEYFILEIAGQHHFLKKALLSDDSIFFSLYKNPIKKETAKTPKNRLETISNLLLAFSIASIFLGLFSTCLPLLFNKMLMIPDVMWMSFLFLPIPIASILFGFYLRKNGYKYKPNVLIGLIMAIFLCFMGSTSFFSSNPYSHSDEAISKAEEMMGIDIPPHLRINTMDWTKSTQHNLRGYVYSTSDIYFESHAVEEFERNLPNDLKWISSIPNELVGIISTECEISSGDYYIIYNTDTGEFNTLPSKSGTYKFINLLYDTEKNTMKLIEYQIEYSK